MTTGVVVPDVAEPLLGFRVWRFHDATLSLFSVTRGDVPRRQPRTRALLATPEGAWPPDEPLHAECSLRDHDGNRHEPPGPDCTCGLYAAYSVDVVAVYIKRAPVLGLVQGFGTTVPGDDGFRSQHARVACLFAVEPEFTIPRRQLDRLADRYNVPLVVPHSDRPEDYRHGVRSGFAEGWQLDFDNDA